MGVTDEKWLETAALKAGNRSLCQNGLHMVTRLRLVESLAMGHASTWVKLSGVIVNKALSILVGVLFIFLQSAAMAEEQAGLVYWNKIKADAVTTESGLQYKALITGKGRKPKKNSKVKVHYRGLFLNGVVFDSSFNEDEPVTLSLKSVIKGWKEGIQLMPAGSVFVFLIPPELAYGERGSGVIPPNATLLFEVELFAR